MDKLSKKRIVLGILLFVYSLLMVNHLLNFNFLAPYDKKILVVATAVLVIFALHVLSLTPDNGNRRSDDKSPEDR